jgi:hypothetical protein
MIIKAEAPEGDLQDSLIAEGFEEERKKMTDKLLAIKQARWLVWPWRGMRRGWRKTGGGKWKRRR